MTPFYTRSGDDGLTSLLGKGRVKKSDPRIEANGALDEANAALGLVRSMCENVEWKNTLLTIQRDLFMIMTEVAVTPDARERFPVFPKEKVDWLEERISTLEKETVIPHEFIVPGDIPVAAMTDLGRTIVRRAERRVSGLLEDGHLENQTILEYLNRLSSYCFVLECAMIQHAGREKPTLAKKE
jgi:cob(I)alamin adenosyltransferase